MSGHTYRIDVAGHHRPHYCRASDDRTAIRHFLRARKYLLQRAGKIKLSVYRYQHAGLLWTGIDTTRPAETWEIETGAFRR